MGTKNQIYVNETIFKKGHIPIEETFRIDTYVGKKIESQDLEEENDEDPSMIFESMVKSSLHNTHLG